jgi:putative ABC transport system permease protein
VFVPWTQENTGIPYLVAKVTGDEASALPVVRRVAESVDPPTGIDQMTTMEALVSRATAQPRFTTRTVAGALALLLAAIGIYGTLASIVGARTREIAIRVSLGAAHRTVIPDVLRRGLAPVLVGVAVGVVTAAALARTFETLLFEVAPLDASSFVAGALLLLAAALAAALLPVIRILHVDPAIALRAE